MENKLKQGLTVSLGTTDFTEGTSDNVPIRHIDILFETVDHNADAIIWRILSVSQPPETYQVSLPIFTYRIIES